MPPSLLDDHLLGTAQATYKASALLLAHTPPRVHLGILTHTDSPLPASTLRARGHLDGVAFAAARAEGGAMAFEPAIACALGG